METTETAGPGGDASPAGDLAAMGAPTDLGAGVACPDILRLAEAIAAPPWPGRYERAFKP